MQYAYLLLIPRIESFSDSDAKATSDDGDAWHPRLSQSSE